MFKKGKTTANGKAASDEVYAKLEAAGCDPIAMLAELAINANTPLDARIGILKDLASYTAPKRKAVDVTSGGEAGLTVKIIKYSSNTVADMEKLMKPEALAEERGEAYDDGEQIEGKEAEEATG